MNVLNTKTYAGNTAVKFNIKKAFDTLDWCFLLTTLRAFYFCETFVLWVHEILRSTRFSIKINSALYGFFQCVRGVRQGDPLSLLLFVITEDVLSKAINRLIHRGIIHPISSPRGQIADSHAFYVDDLIMFYKAEMSELRALMDLFEPYGEISGQQISTEKCSIFLASISQLTVSKILWIS